MTRINVGRIPGDDVSFVCKSAFEAYPQIQPQQIQIFTFINSLFTSPRIKKPHKNL
jgi:hypothetical protein